MTIGGNIEIYGGNIPLKHFCHDPEGGNELLVSFQERAALRRLFQLEQKRERTAYRAQMKEDFEKDVPPIDFNNLTPYPMLK